MWLIPPSLTLILSKDMMISTADGETFAVVFLLQCDICIILYFRIE